eukprot:1064428-Prymnesium_polylepis.1
MASAPLTSFPAGFAGAGGPMLAAATFAPFEAGPHVNFQPIVVSTSITPSSLPYHSSTHAR